MMGSSRENYCYDLIFINHGLQNQVIRRYNSKYRFTKILWVVLLYSRELLIGNLQFDDISITYDHNVRCFVRHTNILNVCDLHELIFVS